MKEFEGKVALVTGDGSEIGRATAVQNARLREIEQTALNAFTLLFFSKLA